MLLRKLKDDGFRLRLQENNARRQVIDQGN